MKPRILRRDFYQGKCYFCPRTLTTGVALFVGDDSRAVPAGPKCATKNAEDKHDWPDLTRGVDVLEENADAAAIGGHGGGSTGVHSDAAVDRRCAIEYVVLRQHVLADWKWPRYAKLQAAFEAYRRGGFTDEHVADAFRNMKWADTSAPHLTLRHLQACYAARRLLECMIDQVRGEGRDTKYLRNRLGELRWKRCIPAERIQGTNNWIKHRWPKLRLRAETFAAVEALDGARVRLGFGGNDDEPR